MSDRQLHANDKIHVWFDDGTDADAEVIVPSDAGPDFYRIRVWWGGPRNMPRNSILTPRDRWERRP